MALSGFGRVGLNTGQFEGPEQIGQGPGANAQPPVLFDIPVPLSPEDAARILESVSFVDHPLSGAAPPDDLSRTAIFAVSAAPGRGVSHAGGMSGNEGKKP